MICCSPTQSVSALPRVGIVPGVSDVEIVTLAVMQALLGHTSETLGLRYASTHLRALFPNLRRAELLGIRNRSVTGEPRRRRRDAGL